MADPDGEQRGRPEPTDRRSTSTDARDQRRDRLPLQLRTLSLALLVVGFTGALVNDTVPVSPESVYSYVFLAGVVGGFASIYLGIFRHDDVEE